MTKTTDVFVIIKKQKEKDDCHVIENVCFGEVSLFVLVKFLCK